MNELLAKLGIKGGSVVGGTAGHARYLIIADANGLIDQSWISGGVVLTPHTNIYYVDGAVGNDANNGSIANPLQTIAGALTRNIADGASKMIIFLAPGTYAGATVTDAAQDAITVIGNEPNSVTISGTFQFNNASGDNEIAFHGVTVTTASDLNAAGLFDVYLHGRSVLTNASSANAGGGGDVVVLEESNLINPPTNLNKTGHTFLLNNPHSTTLELARTAGDTFAGDVNMGSNKLTNLSNATDPQDAVAYSQLTAFIGTFVWQDPVLDKDLTAPPGGPLTGDRYIVGPAATGAWATHDDEIAEWNGASWDFYIPVEGFMTWVEDEDKLYAYTSSWVVFEATLDHNQMTNLTVGDPHTQYMQESNNLSDVADVPTSRTNLGLGDSAVRDVGTGAGDVAAGNILAIAQNRALIIVNSLTALDGTHHTVLGDTSLGIVPLTLPAIDATTDGRIYLIKNIGSASNNVTVTGDGADEVEEPGSLNSYSGTVNIEDGLAVLIQADLTNSRWSILSIIRNPTGGIDPLPTWDYSNLTADADPGVGNFRLNNADHTLVTEIYINEVTSSSANLSVLLNSLGNSNVLYLHQQSSETSVLVYSVTGAVTDAGSYIKIPVSYVSAGSTPISNGSQIAISFISLPSSATMQATYNATVSEPEITTSVARGAFTVRRGSAADTDNIYEGQNGAGVTKFAVDGTGKITGDHLNVAEQVGLPAGAGAGELWIQSVDATTKRLKFYDGVNTYSVDLTQE